MELAGGVDVSALPALNALLNLTATALLLCGSVAIRRGRRDVHRAFMLGALCVSVLFVVSYLAYHSIHGDTTYPATAPLRGLYLFVLASHVLLSAILPFVVGVVLYRALRGTFERHKKLARVALPIWLYVSVTGVVIFLMLRAALAYQ
ncbi:MAG: DUF420 domain-containing protein [Deltaproteobacteria bacterium]|nr:DUF420 domain-containing protein [Deltaproteobacteria bacterium]